MTESDLQKLVFSRAVRVDRRPFLARLLSSLRFQVGAKRSKGRVIPLFQVKGGCEF
jgi:hypothetical protein